MDGRLAFYVHLNSISVISGQCAGDNESSVQSGTLFTVGKILPQAGIELGTGRLVGQP